MLGVRYNPDQGPKPWGTHSVHTVVFLENAGRGLLVLLVIAP